MGVAMSPHKRLLLLLLLMAPLGGCIAAVAVGAAAVYGGTKYDSNEMSQEYRANLDETWHATVAELGEMGYPVQQGTKPGPNEGKVEISDVVVRVEKLADERTQVRVRFGTFDTEDHRRKGRLLLQGIANRIP